MQNNNNKVILNTLFLQKNFVHLNINKINFFNSKKIIIITNEIIILY